MIIFDTSELYGLTPSSPKFDFLRALKHSGSQAAGIPWMVREELVAKQVLEYEAAHSRAYASIAALNRKMPWVIDADLQSLDIERAKKYWRGQYEEILETLETSGESARAALSREVYCEKPAKVDSGNKGGARDAAIWLSVIDYLKANPMEKVYFVSSNTRDFGDGIVYPNPMSKDLGSMVSWLSHLTSFDDCISRFSERIEADGAYLKDILTSLISGTPTQIETAAQRLQSSLSRGGDYEGSRIKGGAFEPFLWKGWTLPPIAVIRNISGISGHKIGDNEWHTATVDWILVGITYPVDKFQLGGMVRTACQWSIKVLFSTGEDRKLSIVDFENPKALDSNNRADIQPLLDEAMMSPKAMPRILGGDRECLEYLLERQRESELSPPDIIFTRWPDGAILDRPD